MKIPKIKLSDNTYMPQIGFGTWMLQRDEVLLPLEKAWEYGYRHIDTAQIYNNEYEIGDWLINNKIKRSDIYLTTKIWVNNFRNKNDFMKSIKQSLTRLGIESVDMLLLHWAMTKEISINTFKWLIEAREKGYTKSIGVSNFNIERLKNIIDATGVAPSINQIQFDLLNQQKELVNYCNKNNIKVQGYSLLKPYLGSSSRNNMSIKEKNVVDEIAKKYNKSAAQIILRFAIQKNVIIFPKSKTPSRIKQNLEIFDFSINENDIKTLEKINKNEQKLKMDFVAEGEWNWKLERPLHFEKNYKFLNKKNGKENHIHEVIVNDDNEKITR